jgi:hypothetical protein
MSSLRFIEVNGKRHPARQKRRFKVRFSIAPRLLVV